MVVVPVRRNPVHEPFCSFTPGFALKDECSSFFGPELPSGPDGCPHTVDTSRKHQLGKDQGSSLVINSYRGVREAFFHRAALRPGQFAHVRVEPGGIDVRTYRSYLRNRRPNPRPEAYGFGLDVVTPIRLKPEPQPDTQNENANDHTNERQS